MDRIQCKGLGLKPCNYSCGNVDRKSLILVQCGEAEKGSLLNLSAYLQTPWKWKASKNLYYYIHAPNFKQKGPRSLFSETRVTSKHGTILLQSLSLQVTPRLPRYRLGSSFDQDLILSTHVDCAIVLPAHGIQRIANKITSWQGSSNWNIFGVPWIEVYLETAFEVSAILQQHVSATLPHCLVRQLLPLCSCGNTN